MTFVCRGAEPQDAGSEPIGRYAPAVLRRGSAVKAVIIDHWPMLRLGLSRVLQAIDVRVVGEAAAAVEGLRRARSENAGLVLLGDHPGGDAVDAVRQAARLPSRPAI